MSVSYTIITLPDGDEVADVDVSLLTRHEAHDLRLELTQEWFNYQGTESQEVQDFYIKKIEELKAFLGTD